MVFGMPGVAVMKTIRGSLPRSTLRPSTCTAPPPPPLPSGMKFEANADSTPAIALTRRAMSSTRRAFASAGS